MCNYMVYYIKQAQTKLRNSGKIEATVNLLWPPPCIGQMWRSAIKGIFLQTPLEDVQVMSY